MFRIASLTAIGGWVTLLATLGTTAIHAEEATAEQTTKAVKAAGGRLTLQVPTDWESKPPRSRIIEHEYWAPAADGDDVGGRMTAMSAGGSVKANLDRWKSQVKQDGDPAEVETFEVEGQKIHLLDQRGQYMDRRGPFAPPTPRENYRVIGVIVELKAGGLFFVKFYGPAATIEKHAKSFRAMLKSLKVNT